MRARRLPAEKVKNFSFNFSLSLWLARRQKEQPLLQAEACAEAELQVTLEAVEGASRAALNMSHVSSKEAPLPKQSFEHRVMIA